MFCLYLNRHVGDLGNVTAGGDNVAKLNITDKVITLMGPYSIIGRTMVVRLSFTFIYFTFDTLMEGQYSSLLCETELLFAAR